MRVCTFGTADTGKPRVRILLEGLRAENVIVGEYLSNPWAGVEDKSQLRGGLNHIVLALRLILAYPLMIWRYLCAPKHDVVFVSYMGHLDVLVLWPFAKMRGAKIVWDAFLSLYDTVIEDRQLAARGGVRAKLLFAFEALVCRAADVIILDTKAHADYFQMRYHIPQDKLLSVWVGAEEIFLKPKVTPHEKDGSIFRVLFYGQYIPLHGIEFIIEAITTIDDPNIQWTLIGQGQETDKIKNLAQTRVLSNVTFIDWVDYDQLPAEIVKADLCLGVFGNSEKAGRVIPNKVFQIIACGCPLVTMDGPAIREILSPQMPGVWLVEPGSGAAIAEAVLAAKASVHTDAPYHGDLRERISGRAIGKTLTQQLSAFH